MRAMMITGRRRRAAEPMLGILVADARPLARGASCSRRSSGSRDSKAEEALDATDSKAAVASRARSADRGIHRQIRAKGRCPYTRMPRGAAQAVACGLR